jgi:hypothetical protein
LGSALASFLRRSRRFSDLRCRRASASRRASSSSRSSSSSAACASSRAARAASSCAFQRFFGFHALFAPPSPSSSS